MAQLLYVLWNLRQWRSRESILDLHHGLRQWRNGYAFLALHRTQQNVETVAVHGVAMESVTFALAPLLNHKKMDRRQ